VELGVEAVGFQSGLLRLATEESMPRVPVIIFTVHRDPSIGKAQI
jgi:hypothetical protein